MTIAIRAALAQSGLVPIDAQVLLAHVLGRDRAWLVAHASDAIARDDAGTFFALAKRRRDGEPVAYLTGAREFWGLAIGVTPSVLIPRPETETLVEAALARLPIDHDRRVLELGTGSGAIALAIARERPHAHVVATDTSAAAIAVARSNVERLGAANVELVQSDWYEALARDMRFDAIVSNPPYVAAHDPHLAEGDVRFEPRAALVSGASGLDALRAIIAGASQWLADGGFIAVEHGYDQTDAVRVLLERAGFADVASARDLAGIPRVAVARVHR
jgi:release factor glutamine methyltransferase